MKVKICILVLWVVKPPRLENGYESFGRNTPALRHTFSFLFYAGLSFPSMVQFYPEDGGTMFSKTALNCVYLKFIRMRI
jgi:hypothetical protein